MNPGPHGPELDAMSSSDADFVIVQIETSSLSDDSSRDWRSLRVDCYMNHHIGRRRGPRFPRTDSRYLATEELLRQRRSDPVGPFLVRPAMITDEELIDVSPDDQEQHVGGTLGTELRT